METIRRGKSLTPEEHKRIVNNHVNSSILTSDHTNPYVGKTVECECGFQGQVGSNDIVNGNFGDTPDDVTCPNCRRSIWLNKLS